MKEGELGLIEWIWPDGSDWTYGITNLEQEEMLSKNIAQIKPSANHQLKRSPRYACLETPSKKA